MGAAPRTDLVTGSLGGRSQSDPQTGLFTHWARCVNTSRELYFAGAKLLALYPMGPIYEGMGLNVTVLSYLDVVGFGFVTCRELAPELSDLAAGGQRVAPGAGEGSRPEFDCSSVTTERA